MTKSKNHNFSPNSKNKEAKTGFLTPKARLTFIQLRQMFVETPIFHHFNPECHIWIETNISSYAIGSVLSQFVSKTRPDKIITKTDLSQWHLVAFFSRKMIPIKTRHKNL